MSSTDAPVPSCGQVSERCRCVPCRKGQDSRQHPAQLVSADMCVCVDAQVAQASNTCKQRRRGHGLLCLSRCVSAMVCTRLACGACRIVPAKHLLQLPHPPAELVEPMQLLWGQPLSFLQAGQAAQQARVRDRGQERAANSCCMDIQTLPLRLRLGCGCRVPALCACCAVPHLVLGHLEPGLSFGRPW
jgi:hypothetical protein